MNDPSPLDPQPRVNILLVDDQHAKLLSHEAILAEMGENLIKASSARQAFEYLLKYEIALILIDVCMPELDGFELASMIREHPRFQSTAIIFISAVLLTNPDQVRGYQLGGVDYVSVPVVPELLRAKVKVFIELYRKNRQLERFNAELERRVAERTSELQQFNEELERRVEDRTRERETALAQLFEAQKMDAVGRLTGGVAHDFNNLLMAILASLSSLERRLAPTDRSSMRLLSNAIQGAERGAALTQRLLAFSRRQELKPTAVDFMALVSGMDELLRRALGPGIELRKQFAPGLPPVLADANQLELALLNIALNARDAMPDGGTVNLAAQLEGTPPGHEGTLAPGQYVRIRVADSGVGMDEKTLARATEPFFTTKGSGKGTGLGLSMVHGLAAQLGGLLRIGSAIGTGTTVDLWLPLAQTPATAAPRRPPGDDFPQTEPCKVLIVDDDLLVLTGTAALIEDLGHTTIEARSGPDALSKLASGIAVDVIITDLSMPDMSGIQLAREINERYPDIPVILATGYSELPGQPAASSVLKLTKPCSQRDIAMAIHSARLPKLNFETFGNLSSADPLGSAVPDRRQKRTN